MFLNFPNHKIVIIGENPKEPFLVAVLLQSLHEPYNMQITLIEVGYCANNFLNCKTDKDRLEFVADAL